MQFKYLIFALVALVLVFDTLASDADIKDHMEDPTETPVADSAVLDSDIKISSERPTSAAKKAQTSATPKHEEPQSAQPHTVADFIIHPLIAIKPRSNEDGLAGKQAGDSSSTTTPSPWTLFGFNAGQGLGSSVSSSVSQLAGSVSGWLTDRIQLPGLVDSPIRDSSTTSSTTTTTTTQRPDIVVRVQHKGSTRRPLISITNENRPHRFYNNNGLNTAYDEDDDDDLDDPLEEEEEIIKNKNRRRINKNNNKRRKPNREEEDIDDDDEEEEEIRPVRRPQQNRPQRRRRPIIEDDISEEEVDDNDDEPQSGEFDDDEDEEIIEDDEEEENVENDDNDEEEESAPQSVNTRRRQVHYNNNNRVRQQPQRHRFIAGSQRQQPSNVVRRIQRPIVNEDDEDDIADEHFYYGIRSSRPSSKRSQSDATFFRRKQQNVIKQIREITRGQTPAEIGALLRTTPTQTGNKQKRRQATLFINRNGQTIYLAPELLNNEHELVNAQVHKLKQGATKFPQPPLTVPLKRKNAPTQYITIPWSQLGITGPNQIHSVAEGVQSQPIILNIPASAIQAMQNQSAKRKKQPMITPEAVPLLAEASIIDVFKPPKIPHDRLSMDAPIQNPTTGAMPVIIASQKKKKPANNVAPSTILPQRIRPGTVVEKSPSTAAGQQEAAEEMSAQESVHNVESEYIIVGEDNEPVLTQQVQPVYGEARYAYGANGLPYFEVLKNGRVAQLRRSGRELEVAQAGEPSVNQLQPTNGEQFIPVQVISEIEELAPLGEAAVQQKPLEGADVPVNVPVEENRSSEGAVVAA